MFYVRGLPLLILCACLSAFQPPDFYNTDNRLESTDRKNLPQKAEKITSSINYTKSSNNDRDAKKASDTLTRRKQFAHLARLKRSVKLDEDEFEDDDEEEENVIEEPYLHCKESKCKNGGTCFRRGQEFWCVCGPDFAGKWCELNREPSIEGAGCDKSLQNSLAIALGVVMLLFFFFVLILVYWCRRRVPRWENEKEEWDQLLKDRLEDDHKRKMMSAPALPPRPFVPPSHSPNRINSNDSSPEYISLTDVRKYLDNPTVRGSRRWTMDTASLSKPDTKLKKKGLTGVDSLHRAEKTRKETRFKSYHANDCSVPSLSGGYYLKHCHTQTEMTNITADSLYRDANPENIALNSKKVQRAPLEQHSSRSRRLPMDIRSSSANPRAFLEPHSVRSRPLSIDSRSSRGKTNRSEKILLCSE